MPSHRARSMATPKERTPINQRMKTCLLLRMLLLKCSPSSSPSSPGSLPVMRKRTTWIVVKDTIKLKMSFSASVTISCTISARSWRLRAYLASSSTASVAVSRAWCDCLIGLMVFRINKVPAKTNDMMPVVMITGTKAVKGLVLNMECCCISPQASMAAKPPMCANKMLQALLRRSATSLNFFFLMTETSKPHFSSTVVLIFAFVSFRFSARMLVNSTPTTSSSKHTSMASA
mmetsp:Transcript_67855/g.194901  ORF Transcript_67855/g.194901 Transcript_67855/m.194901 type:complete len:232 (+) Transcript_67855:126-821(+)